MMSIFQEFVCIPLLLSELVREMLNCVGLVEEVPESHMDAVTGLSGNGPAYVSIIQCTSISQSIDKATVKV